MVRLGTYLPGRRLGTVLGTGDADELADLEYYLSLNLFSWMRADYRTESGGKVTAFWDKVADGVGARAIDTNHALSQGTSAQQGAASAAFAALNGRLCSQFASSWYDSTIAASNWKFLHDGSGMDYWHIHVTGSVNSTLVATYDASGAGTGYHSSYVSGVSPPSISIGTTIGRGSTAFQILGQRLFSAGQARAMHCVLDSARTPVSEMFAEGSSVASGSAGGLSSGNPLGTLRLGASRTGSFPADYAFADLLIAKAGNAALRANVTRYVQLAYGGLST